MESRSKHDYLEEFKKYLIEENIPKNTMKNYITELKKSFKGQEFQSPNQIKDEYIKDYLKTVKSKQTACNLKIALKKFKELNRDFKYDEFAIDSDMSKKSHKRLTKFNKPLQLANVTRKINSLKNERFKIAYKLMLNGGVRVDEVSNIKKDDIKIAKKGIEININKGKGNIARKVKLIDSNHLATLIPEYLKCFSHYENLFYSKIYMQKKAQDMGFMCHDLRRASSQIVEKLNSHKDNEITVEAVKKHLGHSPKTRTYKKYISRKIIFTKTKWEGLNDSKQKIRSR